ncbi:hypothetical protein LTS08_000302 [Lithohypha guttulata]|nr:hypothetical protein LTS08_000302 [Lithohypha guttulata]
MPPSKKTEMAFMGMMEKFFESHSQCDCPDCRASTRRLQKLAAKAADKRVDKENVSPSPSMSNSKPDADGHYCPDHKPPPPLKKSTKDKDKDKEKSLNSSAAAQSNRADKVNSLLKADSNDAVFSVFKSIPTTADETKLATSIQVATKECKTFAESKAKIISYCHDDSVDLDAVFGLLAKVRQERGILTSAIIKSNSEREKYLGAIHEVDELMVMLRDVAKDGKSTGSEGMRNGLGDMIYKIHELATNPSSLYDELMELREDFYDLQADYEEQRDKFLDIESCHEKLHEDKKRLQEDLAWEKRDHLETRKRVSAISGTQNQIHQTRDNLEKVRDENTELRKELEKLTGELAKINALKHENTQLKKKLAVAEAIKPEAEVEQKLPDTTTSGKKKRSKKLGNDTNPTDDATTANSNVNNAHKTDSDHKKEIKALQQAKAETQSHLDNAQTGLRQLEALLKKAEVAKTKALERQQIEQATAQNWKEMSDGHLEESNRLKQQLDDSMTHAATLQETVHRLEQSVSNVKDKLTAQSQKRSSSPSVQSQTSTTSRSDHESLRMLRKLRGETAQLVQDLDSAKSYPGDPWNVVECTRNMVAAIDHDLESMLITSRDSDMPSAMSDLYLPYLRNDTGLPSPIGPSRTRDPTPPLSIPRGRNPPSSYHRPLLPPGLADPNLGRASPAPVHLPSPIGTGRPMKGQTPSPTPASAKTVAFTTPSSAVLGNGAAGVDWSIWTKR